MSEVGNGQGVAVRLPAGAAAAAVGPPVMGPPGLRGPRGERGDPGGTTTIVFSFAQRTPGELPADGLIEAGWEDVRVPEADIQVGVGQSVEYRGDGYLYLFLGPSAVPGGWIETGQVRGPPGDSGPVGDTGPAGPPGERGLTGNTGSPGPKGDQGDTGPQGARGADGATGAPGATGPKGDQGDRGDTGPGGPPGPQGEPGTPGADGADGDPGAPSFIVMDIYTRSASDVASLIGGLIPAGFDGAGKPPAAYQMKVGEAVLLATPADPYTGQAIVYCGQGGASPQPWIAMKVTGPDGPQGAQGPQGPQGIEGPVGPPGNLWHWYPVDPPTPGIGAPGDCILVLSPSTAMPGNGNVYRVQLGGGYTLDGNLKGPQGEQGPQGPPGDVSWADLGAVVARLDALQARVDRLESFHLATIAADVPLDDNKDVMIGIPVVLPPNADYLASAHLTFELAGGTLIPRLITAWIEGLGAVVLTGPGSGQVTLHGALPYATLDVGPVRAVSTGAGNALLYVRSTPIGPPGANPGQVTVKANTSVIDVVPPPDVPMVAQPRATGLLAR
jgi:collagen triple helix repeat protein